MANYPAEKNLIKLNIRIATPPWDNVKERVHEMFLREYVHLMYSQENPVIRLRFQVLMVNSILKIQMLK